MMDMDRHHQQPPEEQESSASCTAAVPPGFRFHPTEEELVGYYLARKVASPSPNSRIHHLDIIREVDLYRIEPWDLQERCGNNNHGGGGGRIGTTTNADDVDLHHAAHQSTTTTEWYFFSYKDRKYPSGTRTNRATAAGFWKATGRDKPVLSSPSPTRSRSVVIGMRKTLVFYRGRAPNGRKTDWIMHEYRLQSNEHAPAQEEGWVVCRAFQKPIPNHHHHQRTAGCFFPAAACGGCYDDDYDRHYLPPLAMASSSSALLLHPAAAAASSDLLLFESKKQHLSCFGGHEGISILPQLVESPTAAVACSEGAADGYDAQRRQGAYDTGGEHDDDELMILQQQQQQLGAGQAGAIDWSFLDSLLSAASQLHADDYPSTGYS